MYESDVDVWEPSNVYTFSDFTKGMKVMYEIGAANNYFYIGDDSAQGYEYGVANIAAFLAQVMKESLRYNTCDENNWDLVSALGVGLQPSQSVFVFRVSTITFTFLPKGR